MSQQIIFSSGPTKEPNAGYFALPTEFDRQRFSAKWASTEGNDIEQSLQNQPILGTQLAALGWEVWKYPRGHKKDGAPCEVTVKSGKYRLLFRPKQVDEAVNALYGNVSKRLLQNEASGATIAGQPNVDSGMVPNERIKKQYGLNEFGSDDGPDLTENVVDFSPRVEGAPIATGTEKTET